MKKTFYDMFNYYISSSDYNNITYVNDSFDVVIKKISDSMDFQYKKYVEDNYSTKNLKGTRHITIIMAGFTKIITRLDEGNKKAFFDLLIKAKDIEQFSYIIVDSVDNLKKLEYDNWYKMVIENDYGIWVGNGIADQTLIKTNIGFKKVNNEIPEGYGIIVKNTKMNLVKLITDKNDLVRNEGGLR